MIAGDIGAIRRYAPADLKRKTIVVEYANEEDVQDLRKRGASILVTMMPSKGAWLGQPRCCLLYTSRCV